MCGAFFRQCPLSLISFLNHKLTGCPCFFKGCPRHVQGLLGFVAFLARLQAVLHCDFVGCLLGGQRLAVEPVFVRRLVALLSQFCDVVRATGLADAKLTHCFADHVRVIALPAGRTAFR